jgi:hypothetical protein
MERQMNETEQKLLERAIKAETQAKFLVEALYNIRRISPFDKAYYIAEAACDGYEKPKE